MNKYDNVSLLGLVGKAGCGKDTFADELVNGSGWVKVAFADALKQICIDYLGCSYNDVYTQEGKMMRNEEWGMTNREILQRLGTEAMRNGFHPDVWVKILKLRVQKLLDEGNKVIVTDCRFENEVEMVLGLGGIIVEIKRDDAQSNLTASEQKHISEKPLDSKYTTFTIENNGTIADMMDKFFHRMEEFLNEHADIADAFEKGVGKGMVDDKFASDLTLELKKYLLHSPEHVAAVDGGVALTWSVKGSSKKIYLYCMKDSMLLNVCTSESEDGDYLAKFEYGNAENWEEINRKIQENIIGV